VKIFFVCFNGFEGIDEGSDDGCGVGWIDDIEDGSSCGGFKKKKVN
jgi:hypothetical protein